MNNCLKLCFRHNMVSVQIIAALTIFLLISLSTVQADDEFEDISTLSLEHSYDQGPDAAFVKRGIIKIHSYREGRTRFNVDGAVTSSDLIKLKELASNNGLYRIRIPIRNGAAYVSSFTKACSLYESNLSDIITLHVDQSVNILGVSITTPLPYCSGNKMNGDLKLSSFNTTVEVIQTVIGPVPETQSYIEKIEREREEKAKGQQQDNRSFFGKYWMYIVPVFIFLMISSNAAGGGEGGAAR